jgi:PAS domain S-box-containing protein
MAANKFSILVIEDDDLDRMIIKRALKDSRIDHELTFAEDHESGKEATLGKEYDCIFLDYNLPGGTGLELLKSIREFKNTSPIVMVTSQGDEKIAVEAMKLGADDYISKSLISGDGMRQIIRHMITKKKQSLKQLQLENQLNEAQKQLHTVISNAPIILFSLDRNGIFQLFEGRGLEILGIDKQKILNKSFEKNAWLSITHEDFTKAISGDEFTTITEWENKYFETYFSPIRDLDKNITGILGIATDKTANIMAEKELKKAKQLAEDSVKIKEQFLANISHEIRTPMNGIIGLTRILLKTALNPEQLKYLQSINTCSDNLLIIINDLLDVSKIEAGKMTFENIPFSIDDLANQTIELFQAKADEKEVQLSLEKDPTIPAYIEGDPTRLSQILNNLVSNAIKFTDKGEVRLRLKMKSIENEKVTIIFEVKDSGIGIAEKSLSSIFESFTQANSDTTRKFGGTGLGLTIVKNLVEMQKGEIQVKSKPGAGTTFIFSLPYLISSKPVEEKENNDSSTLDITQLKILIAEDNKVNQMVIKKTFADWNTSVDIAENGVKVLEALMEKNYDLILMDIQMPEMDGYTAVKNIRAEFPEPKRSIPIMAMTAHASSIEKQKCLDAGMQDYISKPFDPYTLKKKIVALCQVGASSISEEPEFNTIQRIKTSSSPVSEKQQPQEISGLGEEIALKENTLKKEGYSRINLTYLKQISGDNHAFFIEMIETFLNLTPDALDQELKNIAHRIKPSYAYLGLKDVQNTLTKIENWNNDSDDKNIIAELVSNLELCSKNAFKELRIEMEMNK